MNNENHPDPEPGTLADKLTRLWELKRKTPAEGKPGEQYSMKEIAEECSRLYAESKILSCREEMTAAHASGSEIEAAVGAIGEEKPFIDRRYISDLLNGKRDNPTMIVLEYLARFFEVSPAYFFSGTARTAETEEAEAEIDMMLAFRKFHQAMGGGGKTKAVPLMAAMMRGASVLDPQTVTGILRMNLAAIDSARQDEESDQDA
jgi:transcriptional regulator with XRE-family HTH domain